MNGHTETLKPRKFKRTLTLKNCQPQPKMFVHFRNAIPSRRYFEEYFASRAKSEGALPEVDVRITSTSMIVSGKLSVDKKRVGGLLGKIQDLAAGEFLAASKEAKEARGELSPDGVRRNVKAQPVSIRDQAANPILGKYTEDEAKEAIRQLHHTRVSATFTSSHPYDNLLAAGKMNWEFFDEITGSAQLTLERAVYKSLQKVVEMFSSFAAAKMSVGGKMFKKLNFKVDGLLFKSLKEDSELKAMIEEKIEQGMGQAVGLTDEIMDHLTVLEKSISSIRTFSIVLPAVSVQLQVQGLDFFGIAASGARLAMSKKKCT
ncbi:hypothetical protein DIPPA_32451 [Diplonema papillatum]|nr:hypothetical protein DIPPA_32451 [Diplonema papillatum]